MAFTAQELYRIKRELGYHALTIGSLPYVGYTQLFNTVINQSIDDEVATTSTLVTALGALTAPTPTALTLADATGFAAGSRVVVDVDERTETATVQSIAGAVITVQLQKAHSGTIPVSVEGPITMVREILAKIESVRERMAGVYGEGAIKKVDEIEFYGQRERSMFGSLGGQLMYWRNELASILGICNGWQYRSGSGGSCAVSVY